MTENEPMKNPAGVQTKNMALSTMAEVSSGYKQLVMKRDKIFTQYYNEGLFKSEVPLRSFKKMSPRGNNEEAERRRRRRPLSAATRNYRPLSVTKRAQHSGIVPK